MAKHVDVQQTPTLVEYGDVDKAVSDGMDKAFLEMASRVVTLAKEAVPVDLGFLGGSIMANTNLEKGVGYGNPGTKGGGGANPGTPPKLSQEATGDHEAYVGSAVEYAVYQEFGTRKMAAQPYLRPAIAIVAGGGKASLVMKKYNSDEVKNAVRSSFKETKL